MICYRVIALDTETGDVASWPFGPGAMLDAGEIAADMRRKGYVAGVWSEHRDGWLIPMSRGVAGGQARSRGHRLELVPGGST